MLQNVSLTVCYLTFNIFFIISHCRNVAGDRCKLQIFKPPATAKGRLVTKQQPTTNKIRHTTIYLNISHFHCEVRCIKNTTLRGKKLHPFIFAITLSNRIVFW